MSFGVITDLIEQGHHEHDQMIRKRERSKKNKKGRLKTINKETEQKKERGG